MSSYHGKNGAAKIGGVSLGEVQDFTVDETVSTADNSSMGDTYEKHLPGLTAWAGSLKCWFDPADTAQAALTAGAVVTLQLYPSGTGSGATVLSGTATVIKIGLSVNKGNVVERSFDFKGSGVLTHGTV